MSIPDNLDEFLSDSRFFSIKKTDRATTVGAIDGKVFGCAGSLWVKRFNYRGLLDFFVKKMTRTRAKRLYEINVRLYEKGLPVPGPLAYLDPCLSSRSSFYVSTVIENSDNLYELYKKHSLADAKLTRRIAEAVAKWHSSGAVHGDLKWPNIVVQRDGEDHKIFFVDLDQARLYAEPRLRGVIRDLRRFCRFGIEAGGEEWVDSEFRPQYMACIPHAVKAGIDWSSIKSAATREWHEKGQTRY